MLLFHGSNIVITQPKLIPSLRLLDFGQGFYLTSDMEQAKKWAMRTTLNRGLGKATVSIFEIDDDYRKILNILAFDKPDAEWLEFVCMNRTGNTPQNVYDIVKGPVADDQVARTINNYLSGYLLQEMALQLLLPQRLKDQYAFKTEKALNALVFKEAVL